MARNIARGRRAGFGGRCGVWLRQRLPGKSNCKDSPVGEYPIDKNSIMITSTLATAPLLPQFTLSADPVFPAAGELPAGGLGAVFEGADPDPVPVLVVPVDVDPLKGIVTGSTGFPMRPHIRSILEQGQIQHRWGPTVKLALRLFLRSWLRRFNVSRIEYRGIIPTFALKLVHAADLAQSEFEVWRTTAFNGLSPAVTATSRQSMRVDQQRTGYVPDNAAKKKGRTSRLAATILEGGKRRESAQLYTLETPIVACHIDVMLGKTKFEGIKRRKPSQSKKGSFITHGRLSALGQEVDPRCSAIAQGRPARYFKYYPSGSIPREDVRQHWSKCPSYSHGDRLTTRMFAHRSQGRRTFASLPLRHEFGHV
ncbi:hypothetical protein B0H13DRAFT_1873329 [Mycena leptocephala]|nr:hypothetical protein B0H13DRAFT_1873329 [Mycena leptocephala]